MRIARLVFLLPLVLFCLAGAVAGGQPRQKALLQQTVNAVVRRDSRANPLKPHARANETGIKEMIADKYKKRYEAWKTEYLASETGRAEWESYERSDRFLLTITMSDENARGGGTSKYKWNDAGEFVAATITLGGKLSEGYPSPVYYPVMNSLAHASPSYAGSSSILAATKIAHEFGHVSRMAKTSPTVYRLQTQLIPLYNSILLSNGRNTSDPKLIELAEKMGGTPVEIWEDREYWGEVGAMLFLRDKTANQNYQCALFNRIREFVEMYAKPYRDRFVEVASAPSPTHTCSR